VGRALRLQGRLRQRRDERGAALVEAAIILPLLMVLTFGAIEMGIGFSQKGGLESASRGGARKAATLTAVDDVAGIAIGVQTTEAVNDALDSSAVPQLTSLEVYRSDSDPDVCGSNCIRFLPDSGDPKHFSLTPSTGTWFAGVANRNGCGLTPDKVSVRIKGQFLFLTDLIGNGGIPISATTTLQFEPIGC
jgi:TadE-like protein